MINWQNYLLFKENDVTKGCGLVHAEVPQQIDDALVSELMKQSHAFNMIMRPAPQLRPDGSAYPHRSFFLLGFLHRQQMEGNEPVSQRIIADDLRLAAPTVTLMLNDLEKAGLVERFRDAKDRRVVRVYLTALGNNILTEQMELHRNRIQQLLTCLGEDDTLKLTELLARVVACSGKRIINGKEGC